MFNHSNDVFLVMFVGQLEYVHLPDAHDVLIKFKFVHGKDFVVTTGIQEGITQTASRVGWDALSPLHLNFPLDITLKSTNPFGWPKLMLCAYGRDFLGREVLRGYGSIHMPAAAGRHSLRIPLFKPQPSTTLGAVANWLAGRTPEFIDPSIVTRSSGREVVRTASNGFVHVDISVVTKGLTQLGYACSALESRPISVASYNLPFSLSSGSSKAAATSSSKRSVLDRPARLLSSDEGSASDSGGASRQAGVSGPARAMTAPKTPAADAALSPRRNSSPIAEEIQGEAEGDEDRDDSEDESDDEEDDEVSSAVSSPNNSQPKPAPPQPTPRRRSSAVSAETPPTGQVNDGSQPSPTDQTARDDSSSGSRSSGGTRHRPPQQLQHTVQINT